MDDVSKLQFWLTWIENINVYFEPDKYQLYIRIEGAVKKGIEPETYSKLQRGFLMFPYANKCISSCLPSKSEIKVSWSMKYVDFFDEISFL